MSAGKRQQTFVTTMKTSTALSMSILAFIALWQTCPAPPAVLGTIIIAADGAIGGSAIAAGINHAKDKRAAAGEMDE